MNNKINKLMLDPKQEKVRKGNEWGAGGGGG